MVKVIITSIFCKPHLKKKEIILIISFVYLKKSIFGFITTVMVVFVVLITSLVDLPNNRDKEHLLINLENIPIALATVFFSYGGNIVYPHIEAR